MRWGCCDASRDIEKSAVRWPQARPGRLRNTILNQLEICEDAHKNGGRDENKSCLDNAGDGVAAGGGYRLVGLGAARKRPALESRAHQRSSGRGSDRGAGDVPDNAQRRALLRHLLPQFAATQSAFRALSLRAGQIFLRWLRMSASDVRVDGRSLSTCAYLLWGGERLIGRALSLGGTSECWSNSSARIISPRAPFYLPAVSADGG